MQKQKQTRLYSVSKPCKIVWFVVFRRDGLFVKSHLIYRGLCLTRCTDVLLNLTRLRSSMSRYVRICSYSYLTWSNYYITWCCLTYPISPCCSWSCFCNFLFVQIRPSIYTRSPLPPWVADSIPSVILFCVTFSHLEVSCCIFSWLTFSYLIWIYLSPAHPILSYHISCRTRKNDPGL